MPEATSDPLAERDPALAAGAGGHLIHALLPRCSFPPAGSPVTCAVSGGADSSALLALAVAAGCVVHVMHVDHGLRSGSAEEAEVVRSTAARFGATFATTRAALHDGPNLEARARRARYDLLPRDVLTGHTADDQAETMLINLLRGAGTSGLAGMRAGPHPRRPLIALRHAETVGVCAALGITTVDDPSNQDRRHVRNRVRGELVPLLSEISQRDVVPVLTRQAALLRADGDLLDSLAAKLDPCDAVALAAAPTPLSHRAVRRWLGGEHPPDSATVERVMAVARGEAVACDVGAGRRVERTHQRLRLTEPAAP